MRKYNFIDTEKIGIGVYNLISENHRAIAAMGVIPHYVIEIIQEQVETRLRKFLYPDEDGKELNGIDDNKKAIIAKFSKDIEKEICMNIRTEAVRNKSMETRTIATRTTSNTMCQSIIDV